MLQDVSGVGPKRRDELVRAFKSVRAIREASLEELCAVVPKNTAKAVYDYFHGEEGDAPHPAPPPPEGEGYKEGD